MSNKEAAKETKTEQTEVAATEAPREEIRRTGFEENKTEIRRPEEDYRGRLYVDPKYQKPGKVLRVVNDKAGNIEYLLSIGYTFVRDEVKVGQGSLSDMSGLGSAVQIEVGRNVSQKAYLMEIDKDLFDRRQAEKVRVNREALDSKIEANRFPGQQTKG